MSKDRSVEEEREKNTTNACRPKNGKRRYRELEKESIYKY